MKTKTNAKQRLKSILQGKNMPVTHYPNLTFAESEELDELRKHTVEELSDNQLHRLRILITKKGGSGKLDNLTEAESLEFYELGMKPELSESEHDRHYLLALICQFGKEALQTPLSEEEQLEMKELMYHSVSEEDSERFRLLKGRCLFNQVLDLE